VKDEECSELSSDEEIEVDDERVEIVLSVAEAAGFAPLLLQMQEFQASLNTGFRQVTYLFVPCVL